MSWAPFIPTSSPDLLKHCCGLGLDCMERWRDFSSGRPDVVSARPDWKNTSAFKGLFYPSPEVMGGSSCVQHLLWHLYLFLKIMSEILRQRYDTTALQRKCMSKPILLVVTSAKLLEEDNGFRVLPCDTYLLAWSVLQGTKVTTSHS